jgi:hypothetical protein
VVAVNGKHLLFHGTDPLWLLGSLVEGEMIFNGANKV